MKKRVTIKPRKDIREIEKSIDDWVNTPIEKGQEQEVSSLSIQEKESTKKMTIIIPSHLHRRIKKHCAVYETSMREKIIELLEEAFRE